MVAAPLARVGGPAAARTIGRRRQLRLWDIGAANRLSVAVGPKRADRSRFCLSAARGSRSIATARGAAARRQSTRFASEHAIRVRARGVAHTVPRDLCGSVDRLSRVPEGAMWPCPAVQPVDGTARPCTAPHGPQRRPSPDRRSSAGQAPSTAGARPIGVPSPRLGGRRRGSGPGEGRASERGAGCRRA